MRKCLPNRWLAVLGFVIGLWLTFAPLAAASDSVGRSSSGADSFRLSPPTRAGAAPSLSTIFSAPPGAGSGSSVLTCRLTLLNGTEAPGKIRAAAGAFAVGTGEQARLFLQDIKTNKNGGASFEAPVPPGEWNTMKVGLELFGSRAITSGSLKCQVRSPSSCADSLHTACLLGRFVTQVQLVEGANTIQAEVLSNVGGRAEFSVGEERVALSIKNKCKKTGFEFVFSPSSIPSGVWRTQVTDDITWVKGNHTMQFGGNIRIIRSDYCP